MLLVPAAEAATNQLGDTNNSVKKNIFYATIKSPR